MRFAELSLSELFEESYVVFKKQSDIRNAVLSHSESFYAEAEGPAGVSFAVYADRIKNVRVDHTATCHQKSKHQKPTNLPNITSFRPAFQTTWLFAQGIVFESRQNLAFPIDQNQFCSA